MRPVRHKFNAVRTERDGIRFDSKLEARYYDWLKVQEASGALLFFLRQSPFHLKGGTRLVIDFMEFWSDGSVLFTDVKGIETDAFKIKRREVEARFGIEINVVKKIPTLEVSRK
ncbi:DUF1064 domain-containing protein [Kistimonas asteriae]|uniref:DUF1064 domain-containing protein n=1 Tax=Kistimonas asteriae TaxID=517724 RepID=UPI001BA5659A|nr:DUF1064 domain-containing protein [Kistimonas asteriae]